MQKIEMLSQIFQHKPFQWGLRGDPYLWGEMKDLLKDHPYPDTEEEFLALIEQTYEQLTGGALEEQSSMNSIFFERYDHGGMSSGRISPKFWIETGIPLLLAKYRETK